MTTEEHEVENYTGGNCLEKSKEYIAIGVDLPGGEE